MLKALLILFFTVSLIHCLVMSYDSSAIDRVNCLAGQSVCDNLRQCVSLSLICNGYPDCDDNSDEKGTICFYHKFTCHEYPGKVIRSYLRCDGVNDCPEGSDEIGCLKYSTDETPATTTTSEQFPEHSLDSNISSVVLQREPSLLLNSSNTKWHRQKETPFDGQIELSSPSSSAQLALKTDTTQIMNKSYEQKNLCNHTESYGMTNSEEDQRMKNENSKDPLHLWLIVAIALIIGLGILSMVIFQLYVWIWKKISEKPSSSVVNELPETQVNDLFSAYSISSIGSTSRSIQSSDFYLTNPSIIVLESTH